MNDTLKAALNLYGPEAQTLMVFEEMSELQKELCKHARGRDNREEIAEEIADVLIMLDQMMILHDCESLVTRFRKLKIERLEQRIGRWKGERNHEKVYLFSFCKASWTRKAIFVLRGTADRHSEWHRVDG